MRRATAGRRGPSRDAFTCGDRPGATPLLTLQRQVGNRAVSAAVSNAAATRVARAPGAPGAPGTGTDTDDAAALAAPVARIQRQCGPDGGCGCGCADGEEKPVLRRATAGAAVLRQVVAVQREASRSEHLAALRAAIAAADWKDVAVRLNGFNEPDIRRLSAGLPVGQAANTRASVEQYLAGWPRQELILASLDAGRAEVARLGAVMRAYDVAVTAGDWAGAAAQLTRMGDADVARRLAALTWQQKTDLQAAAGDNSRIVAAIEKSEQERVAKVFADYGAAVRAGNWDTAVRKLNGMSQEDIQSRLSSLDDASLRGMRTAAGTLPGNAQTMCEAEATRRFGRSTPGGDADAADAGGGGGGSTFRFLVGPSLVALGLAYKEGGRMPITAAKLLARGEGASIGAQEIATEEVVALQAEQAAAGTEAAATAGEAAALGGETAALGGETAAAGGGTAAGAGMSIGLVGTVTVAAAGVVAGVALAVGTPLVIARAREVRRLYTEFGPGSQPGTMLLPPGGLAQDSRTRRRLCNCPPQGTNANYGLLDGLGRARSVWATISGTPSPGDKPRANPAGWDERAKMPQPVRAHLLTERLGGNGQLPNLVPFAGTTNTKMYYGYEGPTIAYLAANPGSCVEWDARPVYAGASKLPTGIEVHVKDFCTKLEIVGGQIMNEFL